MMNLDLKSYLSLEAAIEGCFGEGTKEIKRAYEALERYKGIDNEEICIAGNYVGYI